MKACQCGNHTIPGSLVLSKECRLLKLHQHDIKRKLFYFSSNISSIYISDVSHFAPKKFTIVLPFIHTNNYAMTDTHQQ